jgi:hypothetical protein
MLTRASGTNPSRSMTSMTDPKRSSSARRGADHDLQRQLRMGAHGAHHRLDAAVIGP